MQLKILTYNIHKCIGGLDRRFDPERVRQVLHHHSPDVCMLQEVDNLAERSKFHHLSQLLGKLCGYRHHAYFAQHRMWNGGEYGNAVLSRYPILEMKNIDLTIASKKRRGVLHARLRVRLPHGRSRTLHVYNLHLGLSGAERRLQLERFLASHPLAHLHHRAPVVLGGDFNDVWGTLGEMLRPAGFSSPTRRLSTFPAYAPLRALDAIYVRGSARILHYGPSQLAVARQASDHLPLVATVELT
jgi:endonuclease/exonuclease/phosphatase family metal-dependent hydrolase